MRRFCVPAAAATVLLVQLSALEAPAHSVPPGGLTPSRDWTQLISVARDGSPADGQSFRPAVSAAGRFVAFDSAASNLVDDDTNSRQDVFVSDRRTGSTT